MKIEWFQKGDRVEHSKRGKGTYVESYDRFESVVHFDEDSDAEGELLTVSTHLLKKIAE